ncbi:MAG TPA: hypothetical protein DFR83_25440, partial [Deltaproteobacteria bacterium]|nr:hypothetical protein [Deltaproteobacteria bacterium]
MTATKRAVPCLFFLGAPSVVQAATWSVDPSGSGDYTTISAAITAASSGDTIDVAAGTYTEAIDFGGKDLTVQSTSGAASTIIDAGSSGAAFAVTFDDYETSAAVLDGFTIEYSGGQGILVEYSEPTLRNLVLEDLGSTSAYGGAIYITSSSPTVEDSSFSSNEAVRGGHVYMDDLSSPTFSGCTFTGGSATYGGAVFMEDSTIATFSTSTFDANSASSHGGAFYLADFVELDLYDSDLTSNTSGGVGGGLYAGTYSTLTFSGADFDGNVANSGSSDGGGLYANTYGILSFTDSTFTHNEAWGGGGMRVVSAYSLAFDNVTVTDNTANGHAGGAHLVLGSAVASTIDRSTFARNTASSSYYGGNILMGGPSGTTEDFTISSTVIDEGIGGTGGGVYADYITVRFVDSELTNNETSYSSPSSSQYFSGNGGGLFSNYSQVTLESTTVDGNTSVGFGGGVMLYGSTTSYPASLTTDGAIISNNSAAYSGGGVGAYRTYASTSLTDTTVSGNTATRGGGLYAFTATEVIVDGGEFSDNQATGDYGGAVYFYPDTYSASYSISVSGAVFADNYAYFNGGGLYVESVMDAVVEESVFTGNEAGYVSSTSSTSGYGGGIYLYDVDSSGSAVLANNNLCGNEATDGGGFFGAYIGPVLDFSNNAVQSNIARDSGGGLFLTNTTYPDVINNSFVGNAASSAGGGLFVRDAHIDFVNNIVAYQRGGHGFYGDSTVNSHGNFQYNDW